MKIGDVAARAGIGIDAIRFYERKGLISAPARGSSGYRDYSPDVVVNLRFIRRAKDLGFSLKEIGELLALERDERSTAADVKTAAERKLADIQNKIRALQRVRRALGKVIDDCPGRGSTTGCSILRSLGREG